MNLYFDKAKRTFLYMIATGIVAVYATIMLIREVWLLWQGTTFGVVERPISHYFLLMGLRVLMAITYTVMFLHLKSKVQYRINECA